MRYAARRLRTGEWLEYDLPLTNVERTRTLSGPGGITATLDPELRKMKSPDGRYLLLDWGTMIYAIDDESGASPIVGHGIIVPPQAKEGAATTLTCAGISTYPHGMIFDRSKNWGIQQDPLFLFRELWRILQSNGNSDLGVDIVGTEKSTVKVGDNENNYALRYYETPDIGTELDNLAANTPFDYIESVYWANDEHTDDVRRIRIGFPRLGKQRDDLRFAEGENISDPVPGNTPEQYNNDVISIGNGEGSSMKHGRSTVDDGRMRRTTVVTDKTVKSQASVDSLAVSTRERLMGKIEISAFNVVDHPNAPISDINPGDDIRVLCTIPSYGDVDQMSRVISVTVPEDALSATVTVAPSSSFTYKSTIEVASG